MKFILLLFSLLICFQNLSAYEQISIQKTNILKNYNDLLEAINSSISNNNIPELIDNNIYNINFSSSKVSFEIDINNLSDELYEKNILFNALMLDCSLSENFFKFNQNFTECPNFKIIPFKQEKFIYLNYLDNYYRIKKYNPNDNPKDIWLNFFDKEFKSYEVSINPDKYKKLSKYLDLKPKIISYKNNNIKVKIESHFNSKQLHFLLNFF